MNNLFMELENYVDNFSKELKYWYNLYLITITTVQLGKNVM